MKLVSCIRVLYNLLLPHSNHITRRHLELAYQSILSFYIHNVWSKQNVYFKDMVTDHKVNSAAIWCWQLRRRQTLAPQN